MITEEWEKSKISSRYYVVTLRFQWEVWFEDNKKMVEVKKGCCDIVGNYLIFPNETVIIVIIESNLSLKSESDNIITRRNFRLFSHYKLNWDIALAAIQTVEKGENFLRVLSPG